MLNLSFSSLYNHSRFIVFSSSSLRLHSNTFFLFWSNLMLINLNQNRLRFRDGHKNRKMKTEHFSWKLREKEFFFIAVGYFTFNFETVCSYTRIYLQKDDKNRKKSLKSVKRDIEKEKREMIPLMCGQVQSQCIYKEKKNYLHMNLGQFLLI